MSTLTAPEPLVANKLLGVDAITADEVAPHVTTLARELRGEGDRITQVIPVLPPFRW